MARLRRTDRKSANTRKQSREYSRVKLILVMAFFALVWSGLLARAAYIQLWEGPRLSELASRQHLAPEFERGMRGRIYDRKGRVLATSVEAKSVYVRPVQVGDAVQASRALARILNMDEADVAKRLNSRKNFVWIKRQVGDRAAQKVKLAELPGVHLTTEYIRLYPDGHLAGQLIGFAGLDDKGLEGLERTFDERLSGKKATLVLARDASGRRLYLDARGREVDTSGDDIRLTIDAHIQDAAEQALKKAVDKHDGEHGVCLVVDVDSGEVLAWANYPFFDPNLFRRSGPKAWRNRAALDSMEPGSTMKPFLFAAALQESIIAPDTLFFCENGRFKLADRLIRDTHPMGWLEARKVLVESSNIGSAKIGLEMGSQIYWSYLRKLGFGERLGLPIPESEGILRDPGEWTEVDLATASFGQGVGVSSVQLARAYLCLASGGMRRDLRLVAHPERPLSPAVRIFDAQVAKSVLDMMTEVVEGPNSGRRARIAGLATAGKTGTAQKAQKRGGYGDEHMASFVSLIPADNPKFLTLVMVDDPKPQHFGGVVAAPAVKEVNLAALSYAGMLPDPEAEKVLLADTGSGLVPMDTFRRTKPLPMAGKNVPDVSGLPVRRALEVLSKKGIIPMLKGEGVVVKGQRPAPGEPWPDGDNDVFVLWLAGTPN